MASPVPDADLPQPIQKLIDQVVRRTRLWRSEKRDVRAELASHFREGLVELAKENVPAGQAVVQLCEQFGDPRIAARLIRRGKKRQRPVAWKMFVVAWHGFEAALVVLALYVGWIFTGKPNPSIDYVAKMNAQIDHVPESDRGWPIFRRVAIEMIPMSKELSNACDDITRLTPNDPEWPAAIAWLKSNQHLIPDIERAARCRIIGFRYDNQETERLMWEMERRHPTQGTQVSSTFSATHRDPLAPQLISLLLPPLSNYRQAAKLLVLNARVRLEADDWEAAWNSIDSAHRMGRQLLSLPTLIEQLVGVAVIKLSCDAARELLYTQRNSLTSAQLEFVRSTQLFKSTPELIQPDLRFEREHFDDLVQYLFTDGGPGGGHLLPSQLARMSFLNSGSHDESVAAGEAMVHAGRNATLAKYHKLWNQMEALRQLPLFDPRREEADKPVERLVTDPIEKLRYSLVGSMLPSFNAADRQFRVAVMNESATQAVVALLAYNMVHGRFPDTLQTLVPDYLAGTPIDVYRGDELIYRVDAGQSFVLYSVGPNLADDGARSTIIDANCGGCGGRQWADIVYWPPPESVATHPASSVSGR